MWPQKTGDIVLRCKALCRCLESQLWQTGGRMDILFRSKCCT